VDRFRVRDESEDDEDPSKYKKKRLRTGNMKRVKEYEPEWVGCAQKLEDNHRGEYRHDKHRAWS